MSIGGPDSLALTPEPTLEPELPICDPHHHLWEFRPEPLRLSAVPAARPGRGSSQWAPCPFDGIYRGQNAVPHHRTGGDASGG